MGTYETTLNLGVLGDHEVKVKFNIDRVGDIRLVEALLDVGKGIESNILPIMDGEIQDEIKTEIYKELVEPEDPMAIAKRAKEEN